MLEFIQNNLSFVLFILFLSVFLIIKRKNLQVQGSFPLLYMMLYRTKLGLDKMGSWSKSHPRVFLYLGYLSLFIGIVGMVLMTVFMVWQLGFIVENNISSGGGLVLPIQTEKGVESAVPVFYVPFWYWLIALFILAIVHEFAHGVIAKRFGIGIKSSGFAFAGIIVPILPAAFVEPDEKDLAKKPWWQKVAVFGAGSTSNFLFGILFLLLWIGSLSLISTTMTTSAITFEGVMNESSLSEYNVTNGEIIALNGIYDTEQIAKQISNLSVNQSINLTINSNGNLNTYEVKTFPNSLNPNKAMIGISGVDSHPVNREGFGFLGTTPLHIERLLFYTWFLNIAIGMMNLLPFWITDGGQIARTLLEQRFKPDTSMRIYNWLSIFITLLIILTIWPSLLFKLIALF
jgi:membrane-associated protease RseP (regulator of RpoE activity)